MHHSLAGVDPAEARADLVLHDEVGERDDGLDGKEQGQHNGGAAGPCHPRE